MTAKIRLITALVLMHISLLSCETVPFRPPQIPPKQVVTLSPQELTQHIEELLLKKNVTRAEDYIALKQEFDAVIKFLTTEDLKNQYLPRIERSLMRHKHALHLQKEEKADSESKKLERILAGKEVPKKVVKDPEKILVVRQEGEES